MELSDEEVAAAVRSMPTARLDEWRRYAAGPAKGMGPAELSKIFHPRFMRDDPRFVCYSCGQRAVEHSPAQVSRCVGRWISHVVRLSPAPIATAIRTSPTTPVTKGAENRDPDPALAERTAALWAGIHAVEKRRRKGRASPYDVSLQPGGKLPDLGPYRVSTEPRVAGNSRMSPYNVTTEATKNAQ
jgi:hypothetical protein